MLDFQELTKFHSPGYVINVFCDGEEKEFVYGYRETRPQQLKCDSSTLYDIASLTKVYTATLIYIAQEEKKLSVYDFVTDIDARFSQLSQVRILDLLSHNQDIWTDGYLGNAHSKEEFYQILFSAYVKGTFPTYVDTHYIILSTLLETIYHQSFDKILEEKILNPLGLFHTTVYPSGNNIASNNYETLNGSVVDSNTPGQIHDTKARVAKSFGVTTGHASIFTTGHDLLLFLQSFLNCKLLSKETISFMLKHDNRNQKNYDILKKVVSNETDINKMYEIACKQDASFRAMRTYNYMGTRYRNDILQLNDVPLICSDETIVFSGFTGPSFLIDFKENVIIVVLCNVMHNTKLNRTERKKITENIIEEICKKIY